MGVWSYWNTDKIYKTVFRLNNSMDREIYIVTPPAHYTGGPTAEYLLCFTLRKLGVKSYIAFSEKRTDIDPVHPNYKKYECEWVYVDDIDDSNNKILVFPEIYPQLIIKFKKAKKVMYWLSLDHFLIRYYAEHHLLNFGLFYITKYLKRGLITPKLRELKNDYIRYAVEIKKRKACNDSSLSDFLRNEVDFHMVLSNKYIQTFLTKFISTKKILFIHDPIEEDYLNLSQKIDLRTKRNLITFNSRKAFFSTNVLIKQLKKKTKLTIIPLENVGKNLMLTFLSKSKIFIDIGWHPGHDRPPREAALLYNIVVVNQDGGCLYFEDCPLPSRYKIKCREITCVDMFEHSNLLFELVYDSLKHYENYVEEFNYYRDYIINEAHLYKEDVERLISYLI